MIKALLLIFLPVPTWDQIAAAQRKWGSILLLYFLPFLSLTSFVEGYGLVHWARQRGRIPHRVTFSAGEAFVYEVMATVLFVIIVSVLAKLIKVLGETFHGRHTFKQTFTVAAYGMGPILLLRFFNAIPGVSPWVTWIIGITLAAGTLYYGLPVIMRPDPPHALGLYMMSCLLLLFVTGLGVFVTVWYLQGRFTVLESFISRVAEQLPF